MAIKGVGWSGQARVSWTFPRPHSIWLQRHSHSPHQSTAYHPGSRKCLPHQVWCRRQPLQSRFGCQWAETHPYTWGRCSLGLQPVTWLCHCTSCGPTAYTVSTGWSFCRQHSSRHPGVLARFLEDILIVNRDQELCLLHVNTEPFIFHASLPHLELGDALL